MYKRSINKRITTVSLMLFGAFMTLTLTAKTPYEIMEMVDEQRSPETARSRMTMRIFRTLDAEVHDREIRIVTYARGMDESLMEFVTPRNIRGLKVLDAGGAIRVFFPSTGRVRNIGSSDRGGSVGGVGGDFSYEDMGGSGFTSDYGDFELISETAEIWQIAGVPLDKDSQYSRLVFWIDKKLHIPVRVDYYDGAKQVKQLEASQIEVIDGRNVATHLIMKNIERNSRTEIRLADVEWNIPLNDDLFHPNRFYR